MTFVRETVNWEPPVNSMPRLRPLTARVTAEIAMRASEMANQYFLLAMKGKERRPVYRSLPMELLDIAVPLPLRGMSAEAVLSGFLAGFPASERLSLRQGKAPFLFGQLFARLRAGGLVAFRKVRFGAGRAGFFRRGLSRRS